MLRNGWGEGGARFVALAVALVAAGVGCVRYEAAIRIAKSGNVQVSEKVVVDPEWRDEVQDTMDASKKVLDQYIKEARQRGGVTKVFGSDSATAEFRYPSLAGFARSWPDSTDDGQPFDRSVYHRLQENGAPLDELILFRMSPPDPKERQRLQHQRMPVLRFAVVPPVPPVRHNAHHVSEGTYWWQFTDAMQKPDSVWIVWPAASAK